MKRKRWLDITTPDLWGVDRLLEAPDKRPDLRKARTLADDIATERKRTSEIARDPFSHIPQELRHSQYFEGNELNVTHFRGGFCEPTKNKARKVSRQRRKA